MGWDAGIDDEFPVSARTITKLLTWYPYADAYAILY